MKFICTFLLLSLVSVAKSAPANGFVFPDERRQDRKLEPIITPPVLPVLEHLERDPSTLLPGERGAVNHVKPRFGFGSGFNVKPTGNGGLTASISSSANGAGASHSASQSFSFGFNEGFSASHSASQASSFNGFGNGFSGSQASSQAASFNGAGASGSTSSASALGGGFNGLSGSQSASSGFGFNSLNNFPNDPVSFGDGLLDVRHRGVPNFSFPDLARRHKALTAATFKSLPFGNNDDFLALLVSN
ncbi:keratin, type I cytoskeletal 9-like [Pararge aegeria]|uniref:Jg7412 protein n=1 Tax=Pararge aegeria aegeria TaxID=348720 RepID=A0A8S4RR02_9NEOP|nr:keratin, type I cytoskeletal 9-like [Pararge aegeria]CAH2240069.1 jg7412 [Pararge aegeria aegeria]